MDPTPLVPLFSGRRPRSALDWPGGPLVFFLAALLALGFFASESQARFLKDSLPNGLTFAVLPNPGTRSVSVDLWVRAGSRHEAARTNGISHFVEHLLFKGTSRRSAREISREVAAVGGALNGTTTWESTQLQVSILPSSLDLALDVLADIAQNSLMTEEMIEKERKVILEEISLGKIYPPTYMLNLVTRTLFADSPLEMPISGTEETVKGIGRADLLDYYRRHYTPGNAFLTIVGNVEPAAAAARVREKFGAWPGKEGRPLQPFPPFRQSQFREVRERRFLDQAFVVLALQAMGAKDLDRPSFEIINAVLGSGGNSRLYQEIREKKGLSYLVGSLYYPLSDTGLWAVYVGTEPGNVAEVRSLVSREIGRIQKEPLSARELGDMKNYIRGRTLIRSERNSSLAEFLSQGWMTGQWEMPEEYLEKIGSVTAEDVRRTAQTYLREDQRNLIVLRPYPGLQFLRKFF